MPIIQRRDSLASHSFSSSFPSLLQRVYSARGVDNEQQLAYQLRQLQAPSILKGIPQAIQLLAAAIEQQQKIMIVGDFDVDGATSCAVAVLALRALGAGTVDFIVPNRFDFGYGLSPEIVDIAHQQRPDLLITVDNGIASVAGVAHAQALGMKVIITDHHLAPDTLPTAEAIVNPNQPGCEFLSKHLAGVGVIFYVMMALRAHLRQTDWFGRAQIVEPNLAELLDLVALGTVADLVPLDYNNRILVAQGIQRIRNGHVRPGIKALLHVAGKDTANLTSSDFGFIIGPRLNAAGRLDDISIGIQCLLTDSDTLANELSVELDRLNQERRSIEARMQAHALQYLEDLVVDEQHLPWGLCLYDEHWHQGVVGILASRIKERYHRPVIAFARENEQTMKGSARSIPGFHLRDALESIAVKQPDLLRKFGGHAMAAGLSVSLANYSAFQRAFDDAVKAVLSQEHLEEVILTDGALLSNELNIHSAYMLQQAGPWGQQFPEPVFDNEFLVIQQRIVGAKHLKLVVALPESPQQLVDAIFFNVALDQWPNREVQRAHLVYQLSVNHYRGNDTVQLIVRFIEALT